MLEQHGFALAFDDAGQPMTVSASDAQRNRSAQFEVWVPDPASEQTLLLEDKLAMLCWQTRSMQRHLVRDKRREGDIASFCFSRDLNTPPVVVEGEYTEGFSLPPDALPRNTAAFAVTACTDGTRNGLSFELFAIERLMPQRPQRRRLRSSSVGSLTTDTTGLGTASSTSDAEDHPQMMVTLPKRHMRVYVLDAAADEWRLLPQARVLKVRRRQQERISII